MVNRKRIIAPSVLTNALVEKYEVLANTRLKAIEYHFYNDDSSASIGVTLHHIPSGGSAGVDNIMLAEDWFILGPKESRPWSTDQVLNAGDSVEAKAGTTGKITMHMSATEVVGS